MYSVSYCIEEGDFLLCTVIHTISSIYHDFNNKEFVNKQKN